MKTYSVKAKEITREWHLIDATDKVLGKIATEAAELLMGKNKTMFTRNRRLRCGHQRDQNKGDR
jgi:large subunit ribosomal protein L13